MPGQNPNYLVIARKYRPKKFSQVVGQDHVIQTLRNAITTGRIAHAYLLVGPRGIGKTTTARLLAAALNAPDMPSIEADPDHPDILAILEGRSLDVREIDGASNNGVEQVRELRDDVRYPPQTGRYKIYIIDEVHMLSTAAFNALLKTLEEPPHYVKFIFATTEVQKVPATIMSRCQRFDLRRIPTELIARQLAYITEAEGIDAEPGALHAIARLADGGMRDAQSILDQMISYCGESVKESDVLQILGIPSRSSVLEMLAHILKGETAQAWQLLKKLDSQGKDFSRILSDLVTSARELLVSQQAPELLANELPPEDLTAIESLKFILKPAKLLRLVEFLTQAENRMRFTLQPKIWLEITIASAAQIAKEVDLDDVLTAMRNSGISPAAPPFVNNVSCSSQTFQNSDSNEKINPQTANDHAIDKLPANTADDSEKKDAALKAWQNISQRLPTYFLHGINVTSSHNNLCISIDSKILPLLEKEWPQDKIEKELRKIHPDIVAITWQTHTSTLPPPPVVQKDPTNSSQPNKKTEKTPSHSPTNRKNIEQNPITEDTKKLSPQEIEEFQNDPEIKKALENFGARLMEIKKRSSTS